MTTTTTRKGKGTERPEADEEKCREALAALYKNVTMAAHGVNVLTPYVTDRQAAKAMRKQAEQYDTFADQIKDLCKQCDFRPTALCRAAQLMSEVSLKLKMLSDGSLTHAAKILMQGTLNGIIDLCRIDCEQVSDDIRSLHGQVLNYEETALENAKQWL